MLASKPVVLMIFQSIVKIGYYLSASIVNQSNDIIPVVIKAGIDSTVKLDNRELVFVVGIKKAEPP